MDSNRPKTFEQMADEQGLRHRLMYDLHAVSHVLGVPYTTLHDECKAGRLTYHLPEGRTRGYMVRPEWVDEWIEVGTHERYVA